MKISSLSRALLIGTSILLTISIFTPIWRIELAAPQYPEGLAMLIYANKLGGDVDIINGLNHYIGMQTLHAENFIEFTLLTYIIGAFAFFTFITGLVSKNKLLTILLFSFVIFGVVAMIDFWRWEYNYGHNLDPKAAIIVPGMSYQPPLIGFKQLLNFGAYSVPDIGGWLFILSGLIMLTCFLFENNYIRLPSKTKKNTALSILTLALLLSACQSDSPEPIKLNIDNCAFCKMTISDGDFACELKTSKGRIYKFDDLNCLLNYKKENNSVPIQTVYICAFRSNQTLIESNSLFFVESENFMSPMGGNIAAFKDRQVADSFATIYSTTVNNWSKISK